MQLAERPWTEVDEAAASLAMLPVGSTEQHGPHAPLSTDTITAEAVAEAAADAYDDEVIVAPALPYGIAAEHRQFSGTMWLTPDTFRSAVTELLESLIGHGWRRIVIVNGHGGNVTALREVAATITRSEQAFVAPFTWWSVIESTPMGHAGPIETAALLHEAPALVRKDRLEAAAADAAAGWGEWVEGVDLAYDAAEFAPNGVVGDPSEADADEGEAFLDAARDALVRLLAAVADRDLERPSHR